MEVVLAVSKALAARQGRQALKPNDLTNAEELYDRFLTDVEAEEVALDARIGQLAAQAARAYGKLVRHPAGLNMGDCFAHACAKSLGASLLYKGEDFARTDLA